MDGSWGKGVKRSTTLTLEHTDQTFRFMDGDNKIRVFVQQVHCKPINCVEQKLCLLGYTKYLFIVNSDGNYGHSGQGVFIGEVCRVFQGVLRGSKGRELGGLEPA